MDITCNACAVTVAETDDDQPRNRCAITGEYVDLDAPCALPEDRAWEIARAALYFCLQRGQDLEEREQKARERAEWRVA